MLSLNFKRVIKISACFNKRMIIVVAVLVLSAGSLSAYAQTAEANIKSAIAQSLYDESKPIKVNGVEISKAEIERGYAQLAQKRLENSSMNRLVVRNELIAKELFRQQATAQGIEKAAEIKRAIEEAKTNALIQYYVQNNLVLTPITEGQIKEEYEKVRAVMGKKEYKARIIVFADPVQAGSVRERIVKRALKFDQAARQYSSYMTAERGGELDWVSFKTPLVEGQTNGVSTTIATAMIALEPAQVSMTLQEHGKSVLLQMDEVRPTIIPPYEQVAPALRRLLEQKERERATIKMVTGLISSAHIEQ